MKKIDKLILQSFLQTLALTFLTVTFILLNRQLMMYYDDIIGKGLDWQVIAKFIGYFTVFMIPQALPLSILLASLITFGNLGEHFELSAIKSAGISLTRIILPVFLFVGFIAFGAFHMNNKVVPHAALQAFTLLYNIKQTKPTLEIKEGVFYNGLPDISLKVNRKFTADPAALKGVMLYDHQDDKKEVYLADSGRMFTILNERYLKFELYNGHQYKEEYQSANGNKEPLSRATFKRIDLVVDLSSFKMSDAGVGNFSSHRYMMSLHQLDEAMDSIENKMATEKVKLRYLIDDAITSARVDNTPKDDASKLVQATNHARTIKTILENNNSFQNELVLQQLAYKIQWHRIISYSFACIPMLLIGAALGAIIKRGGIGLPFIISIIIFIVFFVLDLQGEKLCNSGAMEAYLAMWTADIFLLVLAAYFLYQARIDGRLFDYDLHNAAAVKFRRIFVRSVAAR